MEIKIEEYLSKEEIQDIVSEEVRTYTRQCIGNANTSNDKGYGFINKLAKRLALEGVQDIIPNFKELINEQIKSTIEKVTLNEFFSSSFGWSSTGNKILNGVLSDNKELLDAKIKEIFATKLK